MGGNDVDVAVDGDPAVVVAAPAARDVDGLAESVRRASAPVIASGGVADLDDIAALAEIDGLGGIITGKALYEGRFDVAAALGRLHGRPAAGATA